jgi:hypothetical protein
MISLEKKNCLITGAGSGIGRALAIELAKEGMNLFLVDIDLERLEKVRKEAEKYRVKAFIQKCDVSRYEDFKNLASAFFSKYEDLDLLINNAGISGRIAVEDLEIEEWKKIFDVNLWSVIYSLKVFLPKMLENGKGHIVNTSSGSGIIGLPYHLHYTASKFAIVGITEGLYSELSSRGLKFSVICPTVIKTNIIEKSSVRIPPKLLNDETKKIIESNLEIIKKEYRKRYSDKGIDPDKAALKYIEGIKKEKLYIFDKKSVPIGMFLKAISKKRYKKVLQKQAEKYDNIFKSIIKELEDN